MVKKKWWIGIRTYKHSKNDIFQAINPTRKDYPGYDLILGPFNTKKKAVHKIMLRNSLQLTK